MRQQPTDSQWAAIRAAEEHVLVAAGAGTGKTSTVVGRILYLLGVEVRGQSIATPVRLRDIAAITFTNAAAADLKRKLREELRAAGLRDVAYEVDGARIGTIHGFCSDILREFALRTGRNPAVRVLEAGESGALVAEAVHDALLRALDEQQVPGLEALFSVWSVGKVEEWLCDLASDGARLDRIAEQGGALGELERTVVKLAALARQEIEQRLAETSAVDFDRMILWTRDLIRANDPVRHALQRRIRTLIVDEFQDVDPVQREIAYLLGEPESRRAGTTRLMLVGDPKQSIYRFRRADVTVWRAVEDDFAAKGLGRVVPLEDNFRSVPAVLGFVDATVGRILDTPIEGAALQPFEAAYLPVAARREAQGAMPAVELIGIAPAPEQKLNLPELRQIEAEAVAQRARELAAEGHSWGDMAVLLASWSDLEVYEGALRAAGVPTYAAGAVGFYQRREVLDLILALETVRDPRDDRALLGFLRSPFVGVKDETLLDLARQAAQPFWEHAAAVQVEEQALLQHGLGLVREHAELRDRIPTHELLERLLDRSGYLAHLVALGEAGQQPLANVRKLLAMAREQRERSVGEFLRALREIRERGDREGEARLYGQGENVVTITSIHSAKGLEWPIVFWCDLARQPMKQSPDLLIGREAIALKDPDTEKGEQQPEAYRLLLANEDAERTAESKRLWYVAATRARDRMIIAGLAAVGMKAGSPGHALLRELGADELAEGPLPYLGQGGQAFTARVHVVIAPEDEESDVDGPEAKAHEGAGEPRVFPPADIPPALTPLAAPAGRARHSATELMVWARCAQRHWFKYVAGLREPEVRRSGDGFMSAIARGQIVHDVLEHTETEEEFEVLLEAAIGRWDAAAPPPETPSGRQYREALAQEIAAIRGDAAYRELDDRPGRRHELPFLQILGPDALIEGKIDLAAPGGEGFALLDVKTGGGDAEAVARKADGYALQRDVYVSALEAVSGAPVRSFAFYFSGARRQVGGALTDEERRTAAAAVRQAIEAMGAGAPALTRFPEECRFCGYKRVGWCDGAPSPA